MNLRQMTMKHIITILTLFFGSCTAIAADTTIVFRQINYSELFDAAKNENKGVMLYFHFDGCGACVKMEETAFKDKSVIDFYNRNFVNYEVNTRKGEGVEINKIYKIQLHPTFLFLDNSGNELHRIVGVYSPEEFYLQAGNATLSDKNLTNYRKLYNAGNRESDFLFDYTYMLRDAQELDSTVVNQYLDAIDAKDFNLKKNISYIYEFSVHNFKVLIPFNNRCFEFMFKNKELFYEYFDDDQVNSRIVWILNSAVYKAIEEKDEAAFMRAVEILKDFDTGEKHLFKEMDGRVTGMITSKNLVLLSFMTFYERMQDKENYSKTLETYISKIWNDANELNNFAWGIYEQADELSEEKLNAAIKCSVRSIDIENNYANNDTYAWLLYKSGDKRKALKQANKAIEIAEKSNRDSSETRKLVDMIEKGR
jgi:thioredoxin-related protein